MQLTRRSLIPQPSKVNELAYGRFPDKTEVITNTFNHVTRSPGRGMNSAPSAYEAWMPPTLPYLTRAYSGSSPHPHVQLLEVTLSEFVLSVGSSDRITCSQQSACLLPTVVLIPLKQSCLPTVQNEMSEWMKVKDLVRCFTFQIIGIPPSKYSYK